MEKQIVMAVIIILAAPFFLMDFFHWTIPYLVKYKKFVVMMMFCPVSRYIFRPSLVRYMESKLLDGDFNVVFPTKEIAVIEFNTEDRVELKLTLEKVEEIGKTKPEGNYGFSCFFPNEKWKGYEELAEDEPEGIYDIGEYLGDKNLKLLSNILFAYHIEDIVSKLHSSKGKKENAVNPW